MASPREDASAASPNGNVEEGERKNPAVSFGFTKTVNKFKSSASSAVVATDEKDYLTGIDGNEPQSLKPSSGPSKELVIPLIHKNRWVKPDSRDNGETSDKKRTETTANSESADAQAVKELIEESRRQLDQWKNDAQSERNLNLSIPLLMQNKVPDGFEDGDKIRVDLRPESSTEADYEQVPVEAYGLAMLKGMGWKKSEGIGLTFKEDVKPVEHQLRPKGLGLEADRSAIKDLEANKRQRPPKPGEERAKEEELTMGPGGCVLVQSGAHKDLYGKIEGVDPDNARVMVKLAIGGKTVTISQYAVKLVFPKEYEKYSKDLSRLSKAHKQAEKAKEREREEQKKREERERAEHKSSERERGNDERKRKHRESSRDREKAPVKEAKRPPAPPAWLQRDLKVRFIDKAFKGGRYYNSKVRIEDVLTPTSCVCQTEEGRLIDNVKQEMLETVVPKKESDLIMVVLGDHKGQVGRILQRDKNKCRAIVQLERHGDKVFTYDYDYICHFVGGAEH